MDQKRGGEDMTTINALLDKIRKQAQPPMDTLLEWLDEELGEIDNAEEEHDRDLWFLQKGRIDMLEEVVKKVVELQQVKQ